MKCKLLILLLLTGFLCHAQPVYYWAKNVGDVNDDQGKSIAVDAAGNVYVSGFFSGTVDFDPGPGVQNLTSNGSSQDCFIAKYTAAGDYLWAAGFGSTSDEMVNSLALDAAGNVYAAGYFFGTVDFDPGPGVQNLTCIGSYDLFILKLDAAGMYSWAKQTGAAGSVVFPQAITVDATGNILFTGYFNGTPDFDPGPGTLNLPLAGAADMFICKWDASGNNIWGRSLGGASLENPAGIATDASGNIYTTGYFLGTNVDFDPGAGTQMLSSIGDADVFVLKIDATGNFVWVKQMGGTGTETSKAITLDANGYIYIGGGFIGTTDFDPGPAANNLTSSGTDIFVTKQDPNGNLVWAKQMGGSTDDVAYGIGVDGTGDVYLTGTFSNTADFDPDVTTTQNLTANGAYDIYIAKLNTTGNYVWAKSMGGANVDMGNGIAVKSADNLSVTGYFKLTVDFDPDAGAQALTAAGSIGGTDVFMARFVPPVMLPLSLLQLQADNNDKTVVLRWMTTQEENTASFSVERSATGKDFTAIGSVPAANTALKNNYAFSDAQPLAGTSFYRLKMIDLNGKFTYSAAIPVRRNGNGAALLVSPNPAKDILYVQAKGSELVTIQIADVNGRIVQQQKISLNGATSFPVNIQSLLPGSYYLILKGRETKQVQQFLKQ